MESIKKIWQYPLELELSKMLIDFGQKLGFSINVGFLRVKKIALFNFQNYHFR